MSESQPKPRLPIFWAVCNTADESVFWNSTSAPPLMRAVAASASLDGSNQLLIHTTLVLMLGLVLCAPNVKLLMLRSTSGIGTEATTPSVLLWVILPASTPAM